MAAAGDGRPRRRDLPGDGTAVAHGAQGQVVLLEGGGGVRQVQPGQVGHQHVGVGGVGLLHAQVAQNVLQQLAGHDGGHVAAADVPAAGGGIGAGEGGLGAVIGQQDNHLRIIRRGEAQEGDNGVVVAVYRLGGAGLAADAVALHGGVVAGAAVHNALQDGPAALAGLLAHHLAHLGGLVALKHVALAVGHLADHIGLHQVAAVDDGGGRCDKLNGGHLEALAEGGHRQIHSGEFIPGPDQAAIVLLAQHIDAGFLQESEVLQIVVELFRTQGLADLDEGRVAGVGHRFGQVLVAMTIPVGAFDGGAVPAVHLSHTGAVEVAVLGDHALLQGGGQDDGLESGARLVGAADGAVGPLCIQHLGLRRRNGFVPGLLAGSPLCQCLLVGLLLSVTATLDVFQVLVEHRVAYRPRVVQVKSWGVCPSQDFSRIGVHGDAEAAVLHLELLDALLQDALTVGLDGTV